MTKKEIITQLLKRQTNNSLSNYIIHDHYVDSDQIKLFYEKYNKLFVPESYMRILTKGLKKGNFIYNDEPIKIEKYDKTYYHKYYSDSKPKYTTHEVTFSYNGPKRMGTDWTELHSNLGYYYFKPVGVECFYMIERKMHESLARVM